MLLSSVLVLGVCGLPYGAALHVGLDHEKMMKTNSTLAGDVFYTLDESGARLRRLIPMTASATASAPSLISTSSGASALWKASYAKDSIMQIQCRGEDRTGWESLDHDFDVKLPPQASYADAGQGYSVIFRDTRVNEIGFGTHFYQKFAILPEGESDKTTALFTVRMDSPHFYTGEKVWKVSKGYCKGEFPFQRCYGTGASSTTWREIYCSPIVEVVDKDNRPKVPPTGSWMYMWSPNVPYSCDWKLPDTLDNDELFNGRPVRRVSTPPMSVEFFNGESNGFNSNVGVTENWENADDPTGKSSSSAETKEKETVLFLTIATALQEAFTVGGSGN